MAGAEREPAGFGSRLEGVHVLLVDDHAAVREVITRLLGSYGARVTAVSGVAEALAALDREPPDVVLSDLEMPGADGYVLIQKMRALPRDRCGHTPAVALTRSTSAGDWNRARRAGFQRQVAKPVDAGQLVAIVRDLAAPVAGRRSMRPASEGEAQGRLG